MYLLECKNLCKNYGEKQALKNVNLNIERGKIIGLLGKNGMGKSTLIKLINDLLTPTSGEIRILGEKIGVKTKAMISYLPERTYLDKNMTVDKTVKYFSRFYDNFDSEKAYRLLADLDLDTTQKLSSSKSRFQIVPFLCAFLPETVTASENASKPPSAS